MFPVFNLFLFCFAIHCYEAEIQQNLKIDADGVGRCNCQNLSYLLPYTAKRKTNCTIQVELSYFTNFTDITETYDDTLEYKFDCTALQHVMYEESYNSKNIQKEIEDFTASKQSENDYCQL